MLLFKRLGQSLMMTPIPQLASTYSLTTAVNTFTGLDGDDTFDATVNNSLTSFDTLVGGGGTDTLTANFSTAGTVRVNTTVVSNSHLPTLVQL